MRTAATAAAWWPRAAPRGARSRAGPGALARLSLRPSHLLPLGGEPACPLGGGRAAAHGSDGLWRTQAGALCRRVTRGWETDALPVCPSPFLRSSPGPCVSPGTESARCLQAREVK